MKSKSVHNLDALEAEIYRQKLQIRDLEDELGRHWQHLQNHYPGLLVNSLISSRRPAEEPAVGLLNRLLQNEKMKSVFDSAVDQIAEKAADRLRDIAARWKD